MALPAPFHETAGWEVVFDLAQAGFKDWWFPATGIGFVLVFGLSLFFGNRHAGVRGQMGFAVSVFGVGFSILWTIVTFTGIGGAYLRVRKAYDTGACVVSEGPVRNLSIDVKDGEQFDVGGRHFEYSPYQVGPGYNRGARHGGPSLSGRYVRICSVGGDIVRLDIRIST